MNYEVGSGKKQSITWELITAITPEPTDALITLPFYHKDSFDRLLVAQAIVENIPIISVDTVLDRYGIQRLW